MVVVVIDSLRIGALQLLWLPLTPAVFAWKDGMVGDPRHLRRRLVSCLMM